MTGMKSQLFCTDQYAGVQDRIKEFLNSQDQFLSGSTAKSTRAVGDAIQHILSENFQAVLGTELCAKYSSQFARRAMADLAFEDVDGFYYVVDVKTHRLGTRGSARYINENKDFASGIWLTKGWVGCDNHVFGPF